MNKGGRPACLWPIFFFNFEGADFLLSNPFIKKKDQETRRLLKQTMCCLLTQNPTTTVVAEKSR
jgi:hypothetical protein